ncbi:alpha/beta fold hydrolase [Altererythrobacter sp. Root672]|uniref:alpha/beta fold hydrolase n=1 Tax=Altererythrobacter sp. Root672 TaxID=1736584 RepID=UPI0006F950BF|nr:alpha/beta hydrolase [Altererythrobacter sp. Root672]KRA84558.1 alpha/beta hydrolase [Altererythrobacter sp. Root672]
MSEPVFTVGEWTSADGLTLRYRDYPGGEGRPPILCIPGLTRNARDFESVAAAFAGEWRVICADLRGRGLSDYAKDSASYNPMQYVADISALLDQAGFERVIVIGTSLGGIVAMLLATLAPDRIAGVVLNDIGPHIEEAGLARIRDYVGQGRSYPTWMHAARGLREQGGIAYPEFKVSDWLKLAKRLMAVGPGGRIAFDYDMKIAEPFSTPSGTAPADMWPAFQALAGRPVLAIRGGVSDILSAATLSRMKKELPGLEAVTIRRVGHAPTLDEPQALEAISRLLGKVEAAQA